MKIIRFAFPVLALFTLPFFSAAQTNKDIQGTWQMITTTVTIDNPKRTFIRDSTHYLTLKIITANRMMFTIYDKSADTLRTTGQAIASCNGNTYTEKFEHTTSKGLQKQTMVFTYKIEGDKLTYEGKMGNGHMVEVFRRIE